MGYKDTYAKFNPIVERCCSNNTYFLSLNPLIQTAVRGWIDAHEPRRGCPVIEYAYPPILCNNFGREFLITEWHELYKFMLSIGITSVLVTNIDYQSIYNMIYAGGNVVRCKEYEIMKPNGLEKQGLLQVRFK